MISEWKADFIERKIVNDGHILYDVTVTIDKYRLRYTAVRAKLKQTHPNVVVTNYVGFPVFLRERKNPHNHTYTFTVLTHKKINRGNQNG